MARAQQVWKYVPQRLYARFPAADFYLIVDDDVFINRALLYDFMASRNPEELAIYGPGFCDWGVKQALKQKINKVIRVQMPQVRPARPIVPNFVAQNTASRARLATVHSYRDRGHHALHSSGGEAIFRCQHPLTVH